MPPPSPLEALAVGLSRAEASRKVVLFPVRPALAAVTHDPLAGAVETIATLRDHFEFAVCEAFNAGDPDGLAALLAQITQCADGLLVAESMAKDLAGRMQR